ncbi:alpha/beta hydrolase [Parahaliea mediterranea]|uniref:Alpha/beta hydrolase n=1 Tax=Parahaliea mediterranea TaxID=651086 RepID=A0A939IK09_9GAMM|nr:alpha/beta hydrolase [Parahaliea mediterranea]MBN7796846.1 alpha/beta hydrolase [Parahaliea mediterranea]
MTKRIIKTLAALTVLILIALSSAAGTAYFLIDTGKQMNRNSLWLDIDNGAIDESRYLTLGGVQQFVRIRGRDLNNPILVDLHGGPGSAFTPFTHRVLAPLTEYFTLVEWDQRGAGRSYGDEAMARATDFERMVADTVELLEYVTLRFEQPRVVLVGHSWGTNLGLKVIAQRPDLVSAYVGVGQALGWKSGFDESLRLMKEAARGAGDSETLQALESVPPWPEDPELGADHVATIQRHLSRFGASIHALRDPQDGLHSHLMLDTILSPDLSMGELYKKFFPDPMSPANEALLVDLYDYEITYPDEYVFEVPVFIFQGEHDWQTPTTLIKEWFKQVRAPVKEYVAFEDSAHYVVNEEPGKYLYSLVAKVRPLAVRAAVEGQ